MHVYSNDVEVFRINLAEWQKEGEKKKSVSDGSLDEDKTLFRLNEGKII